jgi:glycogen operon protein
LSTDAILPGAPEPLGLRLTEHGANVAVYSETAETVELCLFDAAGAETDRLALPGRTGPIFHGFVPGLRAGARYGLRAHGPWRPEEGLRFNPNKLLLDPYALALDGPIALHDSLLSWEQDSAPFAPKAIAIAPQIALPARRKIPWSETVIYELHVRGFTRLRDGAPDYLRGTFAGLAHPKSIAHLVDLGVTTLEIMPCAAWIDEQHLHAAGLANYWGYNPIALMAPDPRLAPGGWDEVRESVAALQAAGLEVLIDIVLNHTGEGDENGPTLCFRGLDNATYHRLEPANPARYVNDAGCGNVLRLDHPATLRIAMDALRAWALYGGVDGFRFDLATTLARRDDGFDPHAPLLAAIAQDPHLRDLKLIAEPWDIGPGGYQLGRFPPLWGEWNDKFRDIARKFWRGDHGMIGELATRLAGSADLFPGRKPPSRGVNFVTAHDGFTLADLVSYERKHNEANGERNRDGTNANHSWNNGAEGQTGDADILAARRRDQRNLLTMLLLARGTPMLSMGAEFGQTQHGNNNAYAQDNETAWLDWQKADRSLISFTRALIALRHATPAFTQDRFLTGAPPPGEECADVEWRGEDGEILRDAQWREGERRFLCAVFYAGLPHAGEGSRAALLLNAAHRQARFRLPQPRPSFMWRRTVDTCAEDGAGDGACFDCGETLIVAPRSTLVLIEKPEPSEWPDEAPHPETLDALARAAGIAPDWHDIQGTLHIVPDSTKRALLKALGLPAETQKQARASLKRLARERDRRALPYALVVREDDAIELPLVIDGLPFSPCGRRRLAEGETDEGTASPPAPPHPALPRHLLPQGEKGFAAPGGIELNLVDESGARRRIALDPDAFRRIEKPACDGSAFVAHIPTLPRLPIGRYKISVAGGSPLGSLSPAALPMKGRETEPAFCHLTIAPHACYWPEALDARATGISVQLYSLRRDGDQGIGDFTALAQLAEAAGRAGHATIGINPLHALFAQDRDRASPYHPSDRNFLDPIYLDLGALSETTGLACPLDDATRARAKALSEQDDVDYPAVWALKSRALACHFHGFEEAAKADPDSAQARDFAAFIEEGGARLQEFAMFEALARRDEGVDDEDISLIAFEQWLCDRQLANAAARGRACGLWLGFYRDLAVGAAPDGGEVQAESGLFLRGASVGAPPDPFAEGGQIWALPPPNPLQMARSGYAAFSELLRANMRHAGALRIDHVMALKRLFVVPDGASALEGAYLSYPLDELLGELALESFRARCLVVGEDLGTVPEGFREKMAAANVLSYRVLWFERRGQDFAPPSAYPRKAVACASTHDLPTLAGWRLGMDIDEKDALGLISPEGAMATRLDRVADFLRMQKALSDEGLDPNADQEAAFSAAIHAFLAKTPAALTMFQIDDLLGETIAVNLPGTDRERPNWRRKFFRAVTEDDLKAAPARS